MNKYLSLSELVQKVITNLSMYQGTATQKYAEDRISEMIIQLFYRLYEDRFWAGSTHWYKYTLTGVDGVCAEDVSKDFTDFYDICSISTEDNPKYTLKKLHNSTNPYLITGDTPAYYIPSKDPKKVFSIVPFTATGTIYVYARTKPQEFYPETIIPFDSIALIYGVCYEYCADDGNSSSQIQKFEKLFNDRMIQLTNLDNSGIYDYNDEEAFIGNNQWR